MVKVWSTSAEVWPDSTKLGRCGPHSGQFGPTWSTNNNVRPELVDVGQSSADVDDQTLVDLGQYFSQIWSKLCPALRHIEQSWAQIGAEFRLTEQPFHNFWARHSRKQNNSGWRFFEPPEFRRCASISSQAQSRRSGRYISAPPGLAHATTRHHDSTRADPSAPTTQTHATQTSALQRSPAEVTSSSSPYVVMKASVSPEETLLACSHSHSVKGSPISLGSRARKLRPVVVPRKLNLLTNLSCVPRGQRIYMRRYGGGLCYESHNQGLEQPRARGNIPESRTTALYMHGIFK